ncbi:MAG TPA: hypothetical protein VNH18_03970, partial [Bryobacteraceae bacterium]|nr:hypothetical protein [Bryobacteraceae bacterium]
MAIALQADQAIYGYRNGHRLLQSSCRLDGPAERALLTLSDMSGSRMVDGFEEYVSGFPIPGMDSYAVAKTWYAPEMERPGCVWTHLIIVAASDLHQVKCLNQLMPYFRRPYERRPDGYQTQLSVNAYDSEGASARPKLTGSARVISALYSRPEEPVVIAAPDSRKYEDLVNALWSQQWPSFRAAFSFCTGSLANRASSGKSFDLQIMPYRVARECARSPNSASFIEDLSNSDDDSKVADPNSSWEWAAARDLREGPAGLFRRFLWQYADTSVEARTAYQKLAAVYVRAVSVINTGTGIQEFARELRTQFPRAEQGRKLKKALYGGPEDSHAFLLPELMESERLHVLTSGAAAGAFNSDDFLVGSRIALLWRSDLAGARQLLLQLFDESPPHALVVEALQGFADSISPEELCSTAQLRAAVVPTMVAMNPRLAAINDFWKCSLSLQVFDDVLDALKAHHEVSSVSFWMPAAIRAAPIGVVAPIFSRFGYEAVAAVLEYFERNSGETISEVWRSGLAAHQQDVLDWLNSRETQPSLDVLAIIAGIVEPESIRKSRWSITPWLDLANADNLHGYLQEGSAAAFLLA